MLKKQIVEFFIDDWSKNKNQFIDNTAFVAKFGDGQQVRDALHELKISGYINTVYADDTIYAISLTNKFTSQIQ